jgi:hypothetical protein
LFVQRVDFLVAGYQSASGGGILIDERVECAFEHLQNQIRHPWYIQRQFERRFLGKIPGTIRNLGSFVADTFQVLRNFSRDHDEPQVAGKRRFRQQMDGHFVHFEFEFVDHGIIFANALGKVVIAICEGFDGVFDSGLSVAGHREQNLLQIGELFVEMGLDGHGSGLNRIGPSRNLRFVSLQGS